MIKINIRFRDLNNSTDGYFLKVEIKKFFKLPQCFLHRKNFVSRLEFCVAQKIQVSDLFDDQDVVAAQHNGPELASVHYDIALVERDNASVLELLAEVDSMSKFASENMQS